MPNFSGATHRSTDVWQYYSEKSNDTNRGSVDGRSFWPRGRMIGGTGSINGMLHMRGGPDDYQEWNFDLEWPWKVIKKYFKKSEKIVDPFILNNATLRDNYGTEGEYIIDQLNFTHPEIADKLTHAYKEMGLNYLDDINGPTQLGVGKIRGGQHKGRRVSTATAFLNKAKDRKNLYVVKHAHVNELIIEDYHVKGVRGTMKPGIAMTFYAKKEIILSAGAINTPMILMLSGIGPAKHLQKIGIKPIAITDVGRHLQDHVRIPIPVTIDTGAKPKDDSYWVKAAAQYLLDQTGPHATNYDQPNINAFLKVSETEGQLPDVQIDHNYFVPNTSYVYSMCRNVMSFQEDICKQFESFNKDKEMIIFFVSLCKPHSRGRIMLRSKNPTDFPKIYPKYFKDKRDMETFIKSIKRVTEIVDTPTFRAMKAELKRIKYEGCDATEFGGEEYWECMARTVTYNVYHPVGTARMGDPEDVRSVVGSNLAVYGVQNLRVVDASVMPAIPSGNVNAAVMMIAERASDLIKDDHISAPIKDEL